MLWREFDSKTHFEEWKTQEGNSKVIIFAEDVSPEEAQMLCGKTPAEALFMGAVLKGVGSREKLLELMKEAVSVADSNGWHGEFHQVIVSHLQLMNQIEQEVQHVR
jgi:hypothetical protein